MNQPTEPWEVGSLATQIHGRYLVRRAVDQQTVQGAVPSAVKGTVIGFHGYGETAALQFPELSRVPGIDQWDLIAVDALHQFYTRSGEVVGSWMTSRDREQMIADNLQYVTQVVAQAVRTRPLVVVGFSQGVAMAYRAAALPAVAAAGVVALAGDLPPEVATRSLADFPPVLIARGDQENWYTAERAAEDAATLQKAGVSVSTYEFTGGHQWTEAFRARLGEFLASC